jgi:hypothetical protein
MIHVHSKYFCIIEKEMCHKEHIYGLGNAAGVDATIAFVTVQ